MLFFLFSKGSLWISKSVKDIRIVLVILRFWNVRILASLFLNISHNLNFFSSSFSFPDSIHNDSFPDYNGIYGVSGHVDEI